MQAADASACAVSAHRPETPMRSLRPLSASAVLLATLPLASCRLPFGLGDDSCVEVQGTFDSRAPGYIVGFKSGVPVRETTDALAAKYGFTPKFVYEGPPRGFAAQVSDAALQGLRCESVVRVIEHDGVTGAG
jgi:hypothetical protein